MIDGDRAVGEGDRRLFGVAQALVDVVQLTSRVPTAKNQEVSRQGGRGGWYKRAVCDLTCGLDGAMVGGGMKLWYLEHSLGTRGDAAYLED
jgi:hypothetical protein